MEPARSASELGVLLHDTWEELERERGSHLLDEATLERVGKVGAEATHESLHATIKHFPVYRLPELIDAVARRMREVTEKLPTPVLFYSDDGVRCIAQANEAIAAVLRRTVSFRHATLFRRD